MFLQVIDNGKLNARDFYDKLFSGVSKKTRFATWFERRRQDYELVEGVDFFPFLGKSSGGRPKIEYLISVECAKVLCLVDKTPISKEFRKYLIKVEDNLRNQNLIRKVGIETRKGLTDTIKEVGINDKMHGHAYSTFTKLVYKKSGIEYAKTKNFRDTLNTEQLKVVEQYEKIIDGYLKLGFDYSEIKEQLPNFTKNLIEIEVV